MIENIEETLFHVLTTITLADLTYRGLLVCREYFCYTHHYRPERRFWRVLRRCYYHRSVPGLLLALLLGRQCSGARYTAWLPPADLLVFVPLYWLLRAVGFGECTLDYARAIRENSGVGYAEGLATHYFLGYLKAMLQSDPGSAGLRERIRLYAAKHRVTFATERLIVLVPNSLRVSAQPIESSLLDRAGSLGVVVKSRAGVRRPYNNDVYRFTVPINDTFYYVALEGAAPLVTFFEAMQYQPTASWLMEEVQREVLLKFYSKLRKLLSECPATQHHVELVLYNAFKADGSPQDVGEVVLAHITNIWLEQSKCHHKNSY